VGEKGTHRKKTAEYEKFSFTFSVLVLKIQGVTPEEEHIFRMLGNRILWAIFGPEKQEAGENCTTRNFITCAPK
jgi:hypothetical protein